MKKIITAVLAGIMAVSLCACASSPAATEEATKAPEATAEATAEPTAEPTATPTAEPTATPTEAPTPTPEPTAVPDGVLPYVTKGLVACYEGNYNTVNGYSDSTEVWGDISGNGLDVDLTLSDTCAWQADGLYIDSQKINLPSEWLDTINTDEFTVEFKLNDLNIKGNDFATFINSDANDNFSLFIRVSSAQLEFKLNNSVGTRPVADDGETLMEDAVIAVTCDGNEIALYVNGEEMDRRDAPDTCGVQGNMFIGHNASNKAYTGVVAALRLYDRALTEAELVANANATGHVTGVNLPTEQ